MGGDLLGEGGAGIAVNARELAGDGLGDGGRGAEGVLVEAEADERFRIGSGGGWCGSGGGERGRKGAGEHQAGGLQEIAASKAGHGVPSGAG